MSPVDAVRVAQPHICRFVEQVMGMPVSVALRGRHAFDSRGLAAWHTAIASLREADSVFSTYRADSFVSLLDRGRLELRDCPAEVAEVFAIAERARLESDGAFDIRRPDAAGRIRLDPSGIVKGWAVDRAARAFDDLEGTDVCLSAGGDMVCRTRVAGSPGWQIGIENPLDVDQILATVPIRNGAIATSGSARRGTHILDPRTGRAPNSLASVTVIGTDLTWVDIEATVGVVLGAQALTWLRTRPGRSGLLVGRDGSIERFANPPD